MNLSLSTPGGSMKKAKKENSISTFLGSDASIEGTVEFQGMIRLDGNVKGKIFSNRGTVIVGEKAVIDAEMNVDVAIVMGRVNGTIDARDRIEIYPPARVIGDIGAPVISIEAGVMFNGNCTMKPRIIQEKKASDAPSKPAAVAEKKGQ
jgi:cytoskeletal protein CcmA (bactofilin family)